MNKILKQNNFFFVLIIVFLFFNKGYCQSQFVSSKPSKATIQEAPEIDEIINKVNKTITDIESDKFDEVYFSDSDIDRLEQLSQGLILRMANQAKKLDALDNSYLSDINETDKPMTYDLMMTNMQSIIAGESPAEDFDTSPNPTFINISQNDESGDDFSETVADNLEDSLLTPESENNLIEDGVLTESKEIKPEVVNISDFVINDILDESIPLFKAISKRYQLKMQSLEDEIEEQPADEDNYLDY